MIKTPQSSSVSFLSSSCHKYHKLARIHWKFLLPRNHVGIGPVVPPGLGDGDRATKNTTPRPCGFFRRVTGREKTELCSLEGLLEVRSSEASQLCGQVAKIVMCT